MKFYCRHWYSVNLIFVLLAGIFLVFHWQSLAVVQRLAVLNLMALMIHQFEEYGFPGGEPMIMNYVLQGSSIPDRYPLNQFSAMFTNVFVGVLLYGLPVFFPQMVWMSMGAMLFNFGQLLVHGVMTNRAMKNLYNPGLGAVICLHLPISIYYFWYVADQQLAGTADWVFGALYAIVCAGIAVGFLTYVILPSKHTRWRFADEELERFSVKEKVRQKGLQTAEPGAPKRGPVLMLEKVHAKLHPEDAQ